MSVFDGDLLALGSCIAGLGILISGLLALLFRNPNAPRWTRPEIVPMLISVAVTGITGLGLGYMAWGLSRVVKGTGDWSGLLVLAAVVIVLVLAWRVLGIRQRLRHYAAASGDISRGALLASESSLGADQQPPPRPRPGASSGRRAA